MWLSVFWRKNNKRYVTWENENNHVLKSTYTLSIPYIPSWRFESARQPEDKLAGVTAACMLIFEPKSIVAIIMVLA